MDVWVEVGKKRTFAGALDWPGWCRGGKDEGSALQTLLEYGSRYGQAIETARLSFKPPEDASAFTIVERLQGNSGTDFGAPNVAPSSDAAPVGEADLQRFQRLLEALWRSFDAAVRQAEGRELRKGPRGGGRDLERIVRHVLEADLAYLTQLGGRFEGEKKQADPQETFEPLRQAILTALSEAARGELPRVGPRGGQRWTPRFYIRYSAWHLLDHTWEIADRLPAQ
jgi:hypothetical protein